ncbi:siderophore-interacting protein [Paracoccus aestuariivivens]|uniref:Siderophore-interacting protein n=1 Tax=Paracoccus aestuariivivens TaxID=1820333 RepID=A0A6L6JAG1_9RHOB|nr:siderophore-interacting protein [Paracoccus aestuariivivens]MTH77719.1 siderophore-interacting protein [Paracoccus aestuariivivens]
MRLTTPPEFRSEAMLLGIDFDQIDQLLRHEAEEHGLDVHNGHGRSTWCETEMGEFGAKKRGNNVLVFARAHRPEWLSAIQEAIVEHLAETMPEIARDLRWSSLADIGKLPANFSFAQVGEVRQIGAAFLRMRLHGADLARLATTDSIHFRFVLPPDGDPAPEWPRIGPNGQVQWPAGAKALHRPVYTVCDIDADAGWLDTDIYLHDGGRITEWAKSNPVGAKVGLMGPSGGGIPEAKRLILAGDETAYPAMARIIAQACDAQGEAYLLGRSADYPIPERQGMTVSHLAGGMDELTAILRENIHDTATYIWMASEKGSIAAVRQLLFNGIGHDKHLTHLAAYWSKGGPEQGT